jgi:DNA ligase-1
VQLSALVSLVGRLRATTRKTEKLALIADLLRQARDREIEILALYLSGSLTQRRIGIGWRGLQAAMPAGPRWGSRAARAHRRRGAPLPVRAADRRGAAGRATPRGAVRAIFERQRA